MPRSPERPRMDLLKMSRQEVAAIPLLGRPDLSEEKIYATAEIVDQAIQRQFPESKERERPPLATTLARELGNPNPQLAAFRLLRLYEKRLQEETVGPTDDDSPEEPVLSRSLSGKHRER